MQRTYRRRRLIFISSTNRSIDVDRIREIYEPRELLRRAVASLSNATILYYYIRTNDNQKRRINKKKIKVPDLLVQRSGYEEAIQRIASEQSQRGVVRIRRFARPSRRTSMLTRLRMQ